MSANKLGIHALVWVGGWSEEECVKAVSSSAELGFDIIEIPAFEPREMDAAMTRRVCEQYGMTPTISLGLTHESDINSEDDYTIAKGRQTLLDALEFARAIGSPYLGGVIFGALDRYREPTTETARRNSAAVIKELGQEAAKDDITIGLEFVNRYESNLLNTAQQTLDYLDIVGEDNVKVHADVYHMNIEEKDYRTPLLACGDRLGYVHIGESHRGYLGTGTIDFPEFFSGLREVGYSGPVTFESFSSAVVSRHLSNTLAIWRNLWTDGADLAVQARDFIRAGLAGDL
jgi:D-psicose/D-tagatose/L-ribulose 3-epimerase